MPARVTGVVKLEVDLKRMAELAKDPTLITRELATLMTKHAPVRTGALKSSTYHKNNVAGARAPYAGWVEEMGSQYAYASEAIEEFNVNKYADQVTEPF